MSSVYLYLFDKISQIMYNTDTMNILRTIIRFAIILIFLVLLVFLSITLFKLIPIGINQLATSSLSLTNLASDDTSMDKKNDQPVATTTGGLNGVITQNLGDIIISEPKPIVTTTNTSNTTKTPTKVVYVEKPVYYPQTTYYPTYVTPRVSGLKNIKTTLTAVGTIDRYSGQFFATNSFNINDTVSVKYKISNGEDSATGPFSMRVEMPALDSNDQTKYINNINIPARSSYDVEARFDGINTYNNAVVRIYTDTNNQVSETNEGDNNLFVTLNNVLGGNNNNNCNYYNNCYPYNNCTYYNQNNTNCNNNNNYSNANLTISSIQTGRIVNGVFYTQNNFNVGDIVTIKLRVRNTGGSFTNTWSTRTTYYDNNGSGNFREKITTGERYLGSNEETTLTYSIENINRGNTTFNINIDSNNNVYETNEGDNSTSVNIYTN